MSQKTTIKSDSLGLYVAAGGYIARPFFDTKYKVGDKVLSRHFGGCTRAGVTTPGKPSTHNFKRNGQYEIWCTTGIMNWDYPKMTIEKIEELTKWYKNFVEARATIYKKANSKFNP